MPATIFHWSLHPWAIYAVVGLSLALFADNKGLPLSVLFIPSLVSVLRMTSFGGTAISLLNEGYQAIADVALELKLFTMLDQLPLAGITSFNGIVLAIVFFVTSSDSGSLVIDTITAGSKIDAPLGQRILWASFEDLVAIASLLGGGLGALQAASVSNGLPFAVVLLLGSVALVKGLLSEPRPR